MAQYNSIAFGKARGSIGNVTFSGVKGMEIVKQKNISRSKQSSLKQVKKQEKLTNTYKAYSLIKLGLKGMKYYKREKENIWNCFVRLYNSYGSEITSDTPAQAATALLDSSIGSNMVIIPTQIRRIGGSLRVYFTANRTYLPAYLHLMCTVWNSADIGSITHNHSMTTADYNRGYVVLPDSNLLPDCALFYFFRVKGDFCSSVVVKEVTL